MSRFSLFQLAAPSILVSLQLFIFLADIAECSITIPLPGPAQENATTCKNCIGDDAALFSTVAEVSPPVAVPAVQNSKTSSLKIAGSATQTTNLESSEWQVQWSSGMELSQLALEAQEGADWVSDKAYSGATVPRQLLQAEQQLEAAVVAIGD